MVYDVQFAVEDNRDGAALESATKKLSKAGGT
jgi:hypothetical protein